MAKVLTKIIKPLVGKFPHHIHSTQDFVEQANKVTLLPGECLSSYDVTVLFTSVPVEPALDIVKDLLEQDNTLKERTVLLVKDAILLLGFCLHNSYFSFQDQFYEQVEETAMGSLVSPIIAKLYMKYFEQNALSTANHPSRLWLRYVDDKFVIQKEDNKQNFLEHINSVDPVYSGRQQGRLCHPFLDTTVKPETNIGLSITVYRKTTHTDQYL